MHCVQRSDGTNLWKFATRGKIESSPVVAQEKVVFGSDDGNIYMLALDDGKQLWSYDLGQPTASSPAVAAEKIVIGCDDGCVYCFGRKSK
jgi:outer membrane protein assembly factor BamB